jgi:hypothetical protein
VADNVDLKTRLKTMNRKEKISYIWEYYHLHIIGTIVAIALIVSFVNNILSKKTDILTINVYGNINTEKVDQLQNKIKTKILKDSNNSNVVNIQSTVHTKDIQIESAFIQKLSALVTSGSLDIMIASESDFNKYAKQGMFKNLDSKTLREINATQGNLLKVKSKRDKKEQVYGIKINNPNKLKEMGYDCTDKIVSIIVSAKNRKNAIKFTKWLIK